MKFYPFFPAFILVSIFTLLVFLFAAFQIQIPIIKDFKNPMLMLFLGGFMMCALGTLSHAMNHIVYQGKLDFLVILMILAGTLLLVIGTWAIFGKTPVFGFMTTKMVYYSFFILVMFKIVISTLRILTKF